MTRKLTKEDLTADWSLLPAERKLLANKSRKTHPGFAILLKYFQLSGRFPTSRKEIPISVVKYVVYQLDASLADWGTYPLDGATAKRHRVEIRKWCGYREATLNDQNDLKIWLMAEVIPKEHREDRLREFLLQRCRQRKIDPPAADQITRLILSAVAEHDYRFCEKIGGSFDAVLLNRIDLLLQVLPTDGEWTVWQTLKRDPGKAGLESVKEAVARLQTVRGIGLSHDLFRAVPPKLLDRYAKRAAVEEPFELRRHAALLRATLMAVYLHRRTEELTDHLVDLLVETVHKMGKKAESRIDEGLSEALQKAPSKMAKLYRMAKASVEAPQGIVAEVIFPEVPEKWLQTLIQEVEGTAGYTGKIKKALQSSYRFHYRRMLP